MWFFSFQSFQQSKKKPAASVNDGWQRFLRPEDREKKTVTTTPNKRKAKDEDDDDDADYDVTQDRNGAEDDDDNISEADDEDTMELDDFDKPSIRIINKKPTPAVQRQASTSTKRSNDAQPSKTVARSSSTSGGGPGVKKQSSFMAVAHPKSEIVVGGPQKRKTEAPLPSSGSSKVCCSVHPLVKSRLSVSYSVSYTPRISSLQFNQPAKKSRVEDEDEEVALGSRPKPKRETTKTFVKDEEEEEFGSPVLAPTPPKVSIHVREEKR